LTGSGHVHEARSSLDGGDGFGGELDDVEPVDDGAGTGTGGALDEHPLARAAMAIPSTDTSTRRMATSRSRTAPVIELGPAPRWSRPRLVGVDVCTPTVYLDGSSRRSDHRPLLHELAKGGREGVSILILCPKRNRLRARSVGSLPRRPCDYAVAGMLLAMTSEPAIPPAAHHAADRPSHFSRREISVENTPEPITRLPGGRIAAFVIDGG
jgi:hypothetical protein